MIKRALVVGSLLLAAAGFSGCESKPSPEELQPSMNKLNPHNRGLQAKNVKEMADQMYRSMAGKVAAFNQQNPNGITVVVYPVLSKDGRDYGMITKQIAVAFSKANNANINFTDDVDVLRSIQNREGLSTGGRLLPQYALHAELNTLQNYATTTYYFNLKLTRLADGLVVWNDAYEFDAMN